MNNHKWYVSEAGHPFMIEYTCSKCNVKCAVMDGENPYTDKQCLPEVKLNEFPEK